MTDKHSPQLKFSDTDWKKVKLGDLYTERKEKGNDSLPILSVSIHTGISDKEMEPNSLGKTVNRSEDKSLYKHIYPGDLVLNMMRAWQGAYGVSKVEGMVSPAYITAYPSVEVFPSFMNYYLKRESIISQINNLSYGVTDFRKRLYWGSFVKVSCSLPPINEQEKITSFFEQLENLISLHQQELEALKQTKQGFLQKMFPQEGQTIPTIRFNEFKENWGKYSLGQIGKIRSGVGFPEIEQRGKKGTPFYKVSDMNLKDNNIEMTKANNYVTNEQIKFKNWSVIEELPAVIFAKVGAALMLNRKKLVMSPFLLDNNLMSYSFDSNWDAYFGYTLFQTLFLPKYAQVGALPSFNGSDISTVEVYLPSLNEQREIGEFFKQMDEVIELKEKEIEALKETKKGFLQKMFV